MNDNLDDSLDDFTIKRENLKVGSSTSKKICFVCFNESPLKMMKNTFHFVIRALYILKIFKFLSWLIGHVEKRALLKT